MCRPDDFPPYDNPATVLDADDPHEFPEPRAESARVQHMHKDALMAQGKTIHDHPGGNEHHDHPDLKPAQCDHAMGIHISPHRGCILR